MLPADPLLIVTGTVPTVFLSVLDVVLVTLVEGVVFVTVDLFATVLPPEVWPLVPEIVVALEVELLLLTELLLLMPPLTDVLLPYSLSEPV